MQATNQAYTLSHTKMRILLNRAYPQISGGKFVLNFVFKSAYPDSMARAESRGSMRRRVTSGDMRSLQNLRKLAMAEERERGRERGGERERGGREGERGTRKERGTDANIE